MLTYMHYKSYKKKKICTNMLTSDIFLTVENYYSYKKQYQFFLEEFKLFPIRK